MYVGPAVGLDAVLLKPSHSSIDMATKHYIPQILDSKADLVDVLLNARRNHAINLDGFGIGWYPLDSHSSSSSASSSSPSQAAPDSEAKARAPPMLYKTVKAGPEDDRLMELAQTVKSGCFFAHSRASTTGEVIVENCHPWTYGRFMWMHNGGISRFAEIRRFMLAEMGARFAAQIQGQTDSEAAFFLFLHFLAQAAPQEGAREERQPCDDDERAFIDPEMAIRLPSTAAMLEAAMEQTVQFIVKSVNLVCQEEGGEQETGGPNCTSEEKKKRGAKRRERSSLNFVVTDGANVVAIRFRDSRVEPPPSLFYAHGIMHPPSSKGGSLDFVPPEPGRDGLLRAAIVTSEPLINFEDDAHLQEDWHLIEANHMVIIDERRDLKMRKLCIDCAALVEHKVRRWGRRSRAEGTADVIINNGNLHPESGGVRDEAGHAEREALSSPSCSSEEEEEEDAGHGQEAPGEAAQAAADLPQSSDAAAAEALSTAEDAVKLLAGTSLETAIRVSAIAPPTTTITAGTV
ncbi:hypothetical protein CBR_g29646 [Chara braunii]|uniref:Glutamine amidotransferase type-2 domain-containing protein n=1 Tax=Chara braunii TaxID=69332 RepID=A0A388LB10_CHABU|nr:hypothetical protein CBR_g29646 [Chara braunii]|eukprot:GBG79499.1 hypothetical protein CBR_g29646 [Chara braunii]